MPKPLVALDGPARAMLFGALARNVGLLPHEASGGLLDIQNALASVAMPMLLFGADLREVSRRTGSRRRSSAVTERAGREREISCETKRSSCIVGCFKGMYVDAS